MSRICGLEWLGAVTRCQESSCAVVEAVSHVDPILELSAICRLVIIAPCRRDSTIDSPDWPEGGRSDQRQSCPFLSQAPVLSGIGEEGGTPTGSRIVGGRGYRARTGLSATVSAEQRPLRHTRCEVARGQSQLSIGPEWTVLRVDDDSHGVWCVCTIAQSVHARTSYCVSQQI